MFHREALCGQGDGAWGGAGGKLAHTDYADNGNRPVERERESEAEGRADWHHGGKKINNILQLLCLMYFQIAVLSVVFETKLRRGNYIYAQYSNGSLNSQNTILDMKAYVLSCHPAEDVESQPKGIPAVSPWKKMMFILNEPKKAKLQFYIQI